MLAFQKGTGEVGKMIEEYLTTRKTLKAVISLVDLRHEPSADDVQMYEFLKYYEIPVILVATKADKIPRGKWNKHESMIEEKLDFDKSDTLSSSPQLIRRELKNLGVQFFRKTFTE